MTHQRHNDTNGQLASTKHQDMKQATHRPIPPEGVKWAIVSGIFFAALGLILALYFGGYPGFMFFKQFYWFPLGLALRSYFGLIAGTLLGIVIFWAFGTILGALLWWIINGTKSGHED